MNISKSIETLLTVSFPATISEGENIYYTIYNDDGSTSVARTNSGVVEFGGGAFGALLTFNTADNYCIIWDIDGTNYKASEDIVVNDLNEKIELIKQFNSGRWKIESNQMIFYEDDNITEIARFNLLDAGGSPSVINIFERVKV